MTKQKKRKRGMSLVELVAGMLVFVMIATTATAVVVSILKLYAHANDLAEINNLMDSLSDEVLGDLWIARRVEIVEPYGIDITTDVSRVVYRTGGPLSGDYANRLVKEYNGDGIALPVMDFMYYKQKTIALELGEYEDGDTEKFVALAKTDAYNPIPPAFVLRLTLYAQDGRTIMHRDYAVKPLGLVTE